MKFIEVEHMLNYFHVHLRLIVSERLSLVHTKISRWKIQIFGNFSPFFHFLSWNPDLFVGGFFFKDDQIKIPKRWFLLQSVYKAPVEIHNSYCPEMWELKHSFASGTERNFLLKNKRGNRPNDKFLKRGAHWKDYPGGGYYFDYQM